jgi:ABC-2 type transport system ATP-binding protein
MRPLEQPMNVIETSKLTKYYGKSRGIVDVDMTVAEGEIYGFIGPNGAGKSTTIRTLLGLIYPTSGSATIFGKDCIKFGPEIRQDIGYLPSEVFYYDDMRAIDLLRYSASFYNKDQKAIEARIKDLAQRFDLDLKKKIDDLSYGNKKKVGIIQGLAHQPKLIILDEPTGGLDPLIQQQFFHLLKEENANGATILFSSHILSEVQKLCDRVAIIKDGTIIRVEEIRTLLENSTKRFRLEMAGTPDAAAFDIEGVSDLCAENHSVNFLFRGHINEITKIIAGQDLRDLQVEEPDLEEIFLHYYAKEE